MSEASDPADTRMMGIVHNALRRDLLRVGATVSTQPYPQGRQRRALGEHVVWLMEFLHSHHTGEDDGLWPMVRARNPGAGELLDSLEAEHEGIAPRAKAVLAAGRRYGESPADEARSSLVTALDDLAAVLFAHLDREVEVAMPVVSASISQADWDAVEQKFNIKGKPLKELAKEGHWLIEGIDPEGYEVVVGTVPAVPRFILLHGFGRAYRRGARERWEPDPAAQRVTVG